jgi:hypothetical protein
MLKVAKIIPLNNITTTVDTTAVRITKPWLLIDRIFNASELGKKIYNAVICENDKIMK